MRYIITLLSALILLSLATSGVIANEKIIPKGGTVFVGENGIDLSNCDVRSGDEIAFWSSGSADGVPDSRAKVMDARNFFVDPKLFSGKSGTWFGLVSKKPVFTVDDPWLQLNVVETGLDHDDKWIKRGNLVSFKISTNMNEVSSRQGSAGVPVYINITGPNGTEYSSLDSPTGTFNLKKIYVYYSPYDTGAVWQTGDITKYPDGEYTVKAFVDLNDILEKNPGEGLTSSLESSFLLNKTAPVKVKAEEKTEKNGDKTDKKSSDSSSKKNISNTQNASLSDKIETKKTPTPKVTTQIITEEPTEEITPIETFDDIEKQTFDFTPTPTRKPLVSPPKATPTPKQQPINPLICITGIFAGFLLYYCRKN